MFDEDVHLAGSKPKVFCIGANKTGTTSMETALQELGYKMGFQPGAELLLPQYIERNFKPIIDFARNADAFQDIPFNLPFMYVLLDHYFPNAQFILTVRDSGEQWYRSLVKFHGDWLCNGNIPSTEILMNCSYSYKSFMYDAQCKVIANSHEEPYAKDRLLTFYDTHNQNVRDYFRHKPEKLLEINVGQSGAYQKMCSFLNKVPIHENFPWVLPE